VLAAGADVLVMGSAFFNAADKKSLIESAHNRLNRKETFTEI
jgi:pentose-5-phosphate-3-epimerase